MGQKFSGKKLCHSSWGGKIVNGTGKAEGKAQANQCTTATLMVLLRLINNYGIKVRQNGCTMV